MLKSLLDFAGEYLDDKTNSWLTLQDEEDLKTGEIPKEVLKTVHTGSTSSAVPSMVQVVPAAQGNLVGLLNIMFKTKELDHETVTDIRSHPERYKLDFTVYEAGSDFRLIILNDVLGAVETEQPAK